MGKSDYSILLLAGGLATRLRPVTEKIPKAMLEIAGKPFIYWQLRLLKEHGISKVIICAGYLGEQIEEYVKDGSSFGLSVSYSFDGAKLLGTGGAIKKAEAMLDEEFGIVYGDSYLDIDYRSVFDYFRNHSKTGLMTVFNNQNKWDASNVVYKNGEILKYDKKNKTGDMEYIDYGFGVLRKECFQSLPEDKVIDLANIYMNLVEKKEVLGFEIAKRFYEIGSFKGIEETDLYIRKKYNL